MDTHDEFLGAPASMFTPNPITLHSILDQYLTDGEWHQLFTVNYGQESLGLLIYDGNIEDCNSITGW
tara:strand:- start:79 stop:279 length:201 start_codon:yes stop_codon:yes gene_type:complete